MKGGPSMKPVTVFYLFISLTYLPASQAGAVDQLLSEFAASSHTVFDAGKGKALWTKTYTNNDQSQARSCSTCHTQDLTAAGKHAKTLKPIEPLAPSANTKRLTDVKTINKWLLRNCKWTMGRECTAEEKGHLLTYIKSQ
jgi:cytochrome c553